MGPSRRVFGSRIGRRQIEPTGDPSAGEGSPAAARRVPRWSPTSFLPHEFVLSSTASNATRTAVVTGASSGIGEVFARRLAATNHDLVLVARRVDPMRDLADQLQQHGINAELVPVDLADDQQVNRLVEQLQDYPNLSHLINNAGFGYMGDFADLPLEKHLRMLDVHVTSLVRLTYAVLPGMLQRNEGNVVNVSSLAAWTVGPGQAMYNSTKAFVKSFTEALHAEVEDTNVRVQALCPGITRTGFHDTDEFANFNKSDMPNLWMSADEVVDASIAALERNRAVCVPGFKNQVLTSLFRFDTFRKAAGKTVRKAPKQ